MKRFTKRLSMVLVTLLTLSLLLMGCSSSQSASTPTPTPSAQEKVLTVGVDLPLTGPSARTGQEFKAAVDMAFTEVGYKIGDYKVKVVWIDDQSDPEKATTAYEQAIQKDKIDVGILNWNSSVAVALMETTAKYKIPHFFASGATEVVNQKWASNDKYKYWVAKGWASPAKLSMAYVETINEAVKNGTWIPRNKKVAIYGEDTDWGRSFGTTVGKAFKDSGWEIVNEEYFKNGETDLYPVLTKMKSKDASIIAGTITSPPSVAALIKQAREVNLKSIMIADGLGYAGDWYKMTGDASNGILDNVPLFTTDKAKKFAADFQAKFNIEPSAAAAGQQYDWTRFFIKIANETLKEYGSLSSETIFKYSQAKVITGQTTFDEGIIMKQLKFDAQSSPDPVVGAGKYIFPVVQYFGGKETVIWPSDQTKDVLKVPDYAK